MSADSIEIEGYEIIRQIARGGMAIVYLGREVALDREVAIKVMDTNLEVLGEDLVARFRREAQITAATSHPNIVALHSFGLVHGRPYITMEYLKGGTLRQKLRKAERLDIDQVLALGDQVASALEVLHSRGVVHRDLKPDNILFHEVGHAVLTDFGIAKLFEANTQLTSAGMTLGTYGYISPEQAVGDAIDGRSDVYSLGVILYEALVGSLPTQADSTAAFLYALVHSKVSPLPEEYMALQPLFDRALARAPEDRYANISEFKAAIDDVSRSLLLGELRVSEADPLTEATTIAPAFQPSGADEMTHVVPTPVPVQRVANDRGSAAVAPAQAAALAHGDLEPAEEETIRTDPEDLSGAIPEPVPEAVPEADPEAALEAAEEATVRAEPEPAEEATIRAGDQAEPAAAEKGGSGESGAAAAAADPDLSSLGLNEPILSEARPSASRSSRQFRMRRDTGQSRRVTGQSRRIPISAEAPAAEAPARSTRPALLAAGGLMVLALAAGIGWWALSGQVTSDGSGDVVVSDSAVAPEAAEPNSSAPAAIVEEAVADADADTAGAAPIDPLPAEPAAAPVQEPATLEPAAELVATPPVEASDTAPAPTAAEPAAPASAAPLLTAQLANELSELLLPPVTTADLVQALDALAVAEEPAAAFNSSSVAQPLRDQLNLFVRTQLRDRSYLELGPVLARERSLSGLALLSEDSQRRLDSHLANLEAEAALQYRMGYLSAPEDNNVRRTLENLFAIDPSHAAATELKQQSAQRLASIAEEAWQAGSGELTAEDVLSGAAVEYLEQALLFYPEAADAELWKTTLENWRSSAPPGEEAEDNAVEDAGAEPAAETTSV